MIAKTSYLTVNEAQLYFNGRTNTDDWDLASSTEKFKALTQASSDIDKLQYRGEKSVYQQEHEFPRAWIVQLLEEVQYDTDLVPFAIKYAVCEQALAILGGWDVTQEIDGLSLVSSGYSTVKVAYDRTDIPMHLRCGLCPQAWQFILPFLPDNREVVVLRVG